MADSIVTIENVSLKYKKTKKLKEKMKKRLKN